MGIFNGNAITSKEIRKVEDRKLKADLKKTEKKIKDAAEKVAASEILLTHEAGFLEAEGDEKTYKFAQEELVKNVDVQTANKTYELKLDFGPYHIDFTRSGRHTLIGGKKGHIAAFDAKTGNLKCEFQVKERVNAIKWLHNETMFAVAQKKHVYIYDGTGLELHRLTKHSQISQLEFLPYHFLLVSIGIDGILRYQDTSTGMIVSELHTRLGHCDVMKQNPSNGIIHLGHTNGTVTLWAPSMTTPLVKMLCHNGPVSAVSLDEGGNYMVTTGLDGQMKVWDIRSFKPLNQYYTINPGKTLSISQKGLLAVGHGPHVTIWKDPFKVKQKSPYMYHRLPSENVVDVKFCPFEDILGISYGSGISNILIPGAGEPNYDALEVNPYATVRQRQEGEVKQLLDKLQPDTIALKTDFIGNVISTEQERADKINALSFEANNPVQVYEPKYKMRGRNSAKKKYLSKRRNVIGLTKESKTKTELQVVGREDSQTKQKNPLHRFSKGKY